MSKLGNPTPVSTIIHRLRLMADVGGVLTRDRVKTVVEAADKLQELNDCVELLAERNNSSISSDMFP